MCMPQKKKKHLLFISTSERIQNKSHKYTCLIYTPIIFIYFFWICRYLLATTVIGLAYTVLQTIFSLLYISTGNRCITGDGSFTFEFYGDKVLTYNPSSSLKSYIKETFKIEKLNSWNSWNVFVLFSDRVISTSHRCCCRICGDQWIEEIGWRRNTGRRRQVSEQGIWKCCCRPHRLCLYCIAISFLILCTPKESQLIFPYKIHLFSAVVV